MSSRPGHAPDFQQNTSGSGGISNNVDNSQGQSTTNSHNTTAYNHSNITILNPPPASASSLTQAQADSSIGILHEHVCEGAAFDSAERGPEPPQCYPGTREAIIKSGSSWVDNHSALRCFFLWITGWAGVGKSAILQTLAKKYCLERRLAASFFFCQTSKDRNTIRGFVATIADQLMDSVPGAREIILRRIARNPKIFAKSFDGLWRNLIIDTLCHLKVPRPTHPMLIVIDGIDEIATSKEQCILLQTILESAQLLGPSYKLLIASHPEWHIKQIFQRFSTPDEIFQDNKIELEDNDDTRADLKHFLQTSFSEMRHAPNFQSTPPSQSTSTSPPQSTSTSPSQSTSTSVTD